MSWINELKESYIEIKNEVSWPSSADLQKVTISVAIATLIFALVIFGFDFVSKKAIDLFF